MYDSWIGSLPASYAFIDEYDAAWAPPPSCALLISAQHYRALEYDILKRAVEAEIPTLVIADGILEYRNTWENPELAAGCMFQPLIGHKIACLGRSQARILESWGNLGKCEVVGAPRLDPFIGKKQPLRRTGERLRLLVMTARKPGFTAEQIALTTRSLRDLKFWLSRNPRIHGRDVEVVWRLTGDLAKHLDVENQLTDFQGKDLMGILSEVDAAITAPSTAMLEVMICGLPVAILDYHNNPLFVPAAWQITAPRHFDHVIPELFDPPAPKMLYQETILHDALECRSPAEPRMVHLITEMIRNAESCAQRKEKLRFPIRIMEDEQDNHHLPEESFDLSKLYPHHAIFAEQDRVKLQVYINQLESELKRLKTSLHSRRVWRNVLRYLPGPNKLKRYWRELRGQGQTNFDNTNVPRTPC